MNLLDLIEEAEQAPTAPENPKEMENPIITKREYGSRHKLFPFTEETLKDYRMPKTGKTGLTIICGAAEGVKNGQLLVCAGKDSIAFTVPDNNLEKVKELIPGAHITALVSDNVCVDLKLGPYFGTVSWKLFHGSDTKRVTEFVVR